MCLKYKRLAVSLLKQYWLLLIPPLFLLPGFTGFPYATKEAVYSDITISHYPNAIFLLQSLLKWHVIPLWSPNILSGYPFAADPLSGLWYPPGWFALLFPLPFGFNLLVALHILWGGIGLVRLSKSEGLPNTPAVFGGFAFEALPKIFAHYGAGHLTLIYAVSWTPWLLYATHKTHVSLSGEGGTFQPGVLGKFYNVFRDRQISLQPIILSLVFLADPRWAIYAGVLWASYYFANSCKIGISSILTGIPKLCLWILQAALLAAPLALPLLEYTRLSTRVQMTSEDVLSLSLPVPRVLGLVFPDVAGYHEWMLYSGGVILILSMLVILWQRSPGRRNFWLWVAGFSLVFSFGANVPGLNLLASIPLFNLLRVPSRTLFILGMALALLSSESLDRLMSGVTALERRRINILLFSLTGFILAFCGGVWFILGKLPYNFSWGMVTVIASTIGISLAIRGKYPASFGMLILFGICILDLGIMDFSLYKPRSIRTVLSESLSTVDYLAAQPGYFRVYSPSYSIPQQTAAIYGIELIDGVDPLQLAAYDTFMEKATGVPGSGYSVTVPPFKGDPKLSNAGYRPDAALLGLLNVRYVVSDFELPSKELSLKTRIGDQWIYEDLLALPRAWVQTVGNKIGEDIRQVNITSFQPNRITLEAQGPGLLVLSEINYPGWQVWVDGVKSDPETVADLLRGVRIGAGDHVVIFRFLPLSVYVGLFLFACGLISCLVV
jgi:hypothetical protein